MNDLLSIPCVLMRGGTSKGAFFLSSDLPLDTAERDHVLLSVMGIGDPLQIDGVGGGNPVTSKVAIVGPASVPGADVDYLFAQVRIDRQLVDTSPNCGNMLAGVGPFAAEAGLVRIQQGETMIRIHNVNTGKIIESEISTPNGRVAYLGDASIDGVSGSAAPIALTFLDAAGARTGKLLPTGRASEMIDGIEVTCIDCAMPMMLVEATALGLSGAESPAMLNENRGFLVRLEELRMEAGRRIGFGNVSNQVIPKPVLLSRPDGDADLRVRYFMPAECHPALATTGAVGLATACVTPETIAAKVIGLRPLPTTVRIEHPKGHFDVKLRLRDGKILASVLRTARRLFEGRVLARPYVRTSTPA
ncbi:4-oxalomesaconate tautomerase [Aquamicrobium sp. LC103]|uniref:4-oxalomesaconate tautomerase n=1 Tax=Aquamicrobium sp. LC103 TaxID=1120658 RepID=UPI00063E8700|nr:4-oxalomesaconate tautomerase [Aquamicrobium sp. LC103]TKT69543.1 4-oxalomesaconate tautomerase [Aquamicrobium sp. LC103]